MAIDPRTLVEESRPKSAMPLGKREPGAMRMLRDTWVEDSEGNRRSVSELATVPGSPTYNEKIPNPPCGRCSQDHNPIATAQGKYDHEYIHPDRMGEGALTVLSPGPQAPAGISTVPAGVPAPVAQRVTVMPARGGDDYIVGVEENPPDWDLMDSWKMTTDEVLKFLPILRKLGVKIRDNTGGELAALDLERKGH